MSTNPLLLFSFLALGLFETKEVKFQLVLHSGKDKFEKTNRSEEWFQQVDSRMEVSYSSEISVGKETTKEEGTRDRIKYIPGKDDGNKGHSWMKIEELKGKPILQLSSAVVRLKNAKYPNIFPKRYEKLNELKEGEDYDLIQQTASYELEWVRGSFKDFNDGEDIELRFSEKGTTEFLTDFRKSVAQEVWPVLLKMKGKEAPKPEGTIWIKALKKNKEESFDFRGRIRGNLDRFEIDWIPLQVDITATVKSDS